MNENNDSKSNEINSFEEIDELLNLAKTQIIDTNENIDKHNNNNNNNIDDIIQTSTDDNDSTNTSLKLSYISSQLALYKLKLNKAIKERDKISEQYINIHTLYEKQQDFINHFINTINKRQLYLKEHTNMINQFKNDMINDYNTLKEQYQHNMNQLYIKKINIITCNLNELIEKHNLKNLKNFFN